MTTPRALYEDDKAPFSSKARDLAVWLFHSWPPRIVDTNSCIWMTLAKSTAAPSELRAAAVLPIPLPFYLF
jgi:hypothetical protein